MCPWCQNLEVGCKQKMKKLILLSIGFFILMNVFGCGYLSSGMWTDDPDNWKRAFRSQKPEDVVVLHSWYWRSSHFTYEFRYYFKIEANEGLEKQLLTENDFILMEDVDTWDVTRVFSEAPDWFVEKPIQNYEVYRYRDEVNSNLLVFIDKESREIYLTDYQY